MPCYLISGQNIFTEKEKNRRKRKEETYLFWAQLAEAAQPKSRVVFFPGTGRQAAAWRPCRRRWPPPACPLDPYLRRGGPGRLPSPFPLLWLSLHALSRPFSPHPSAPSRRRHAPPRPPCPCRRATVSREAASEAFVEPLR